MDNPVCPHCGRKRHEETAISGQGYRMFYDIQPGDFTEATWSMSKDGKTMFTRKIKLESGFATLPAIETADLSGEHTICIKGKDAEGNFHCAHGKVFFYKDE